MRYIGKPLRSKVSAEGLIHKQIRSRGVKHAVCCDTGRHPGLKHDRCALSPSPPTVNRHVYELRRGPRSVCRHDGDRSDGFVSLVIPAAVSAGFTAPRCMIPLGSPLSPTMGLKGKKDPRAAQRKSPDWGDAAEGPLLQGAGSAEASTGQTLKTHDSSEQTVGDNSTFGTTNTKPKEGGGRNKQ